MNNLWIILLRGEITESKNVSDGNNLHVYGYRVVRIHVLFCLSTCVHTLGPTFAYCQKLEQSKNI